VSPKKLPTRSATRAEGTGRCRVAEKYLEAAELVSTEDGAAINVAIGIAVLAGIAAGDAICIRSIGERYSGTDHAAAADLLGQVDKALAAELRDLVDLKPKSHYGGALLRTQDRTRALRAASTLVAAALARTI
jgi:hypothetical protein